MSKTLTRYFLLWILFFSIFSLTLVALRLSVVSEDPIEQADSAGPQIL